VLSSIVSARNGLVGLGTSAWDGVHSATTQALLELRPGGCARPPRGAALRKLRGDPGHQLVPRTTSGRQVHVLGRALEAVTIRHARRKATLVSRASLTEGSRAGAEVGAGIAVIPSHLMWTVVVEVS
jgi:hypothetical protein